MQKGAHPLMRFPILVRRKTLMKKRRILAAILLVAMVCTMSFTTAFAADTASASATEVRVNGFLVNFPDEKPFVNSDNRTMIPVRFVGEALGADVSWSRLKNGAVIEKDGVKIVLPVDTNEMIVTRDGKEKTVTLDTKTVLQNGRTFVPIRAIAEELGAWVSFSKAYNTVEIYNDVLTPSEIEQLHSISVGAFWKKNAVDPMKSLLSSSSLYEDLSEYALRNNSAIYDYELRTPKGLYFQTKGHTNEEKIDFMCKAITELMEQDYSREKYYGITATYRTDASCLFISPTTDASWINYGYLTITVPEGADVAGYARAKKAADNDFSTLQPGKSYTFWVESNWEILMGRYYGLTCLSVDNRTNGIDQRWS